MGWTNISSRGQALKQTLGNRGLTPVRVVIIAGVILLVSFPFIFPFTGASGSALPVSPTPPPPGNGGANGGIPEVSFAAGSSGASESDTTVTLEVILSESPTQTVSVDFAVTEGSADGGGVDYALAAGTLTFDPGDTSENISIEIVDDDLDEPDETIVVTLSEPSNATLGDTTSHTHTIEDNDDTPTVAFAAEASSADESVTPALLEVTLSEDSAQTVTVDFAVTEGSADGGGVDYTLAAGTLTFGPGDTSENISIDIVDDDLDEPEETIVLTLSNSSNATLSVSDSHTYTIVDNDGPPSIDFVSASSSGSESVTPVDLEVRLSPPSNQTVTVDFSVAGGTASGVGVDFTLASGTLTFSKGEVIEIISITVIDDGLNEADETIVVTLSNPSKAVLGARTAHTYIIKDNDEVDGGSGGQPDTGTGNIIIGNGNTIGTIIIGDGNVVGNVKIGEQKWFRRAINTSKHRKREIKFKRDHDDDDDDDDGRKKDNKKLRQKLAKGMCKKGGWETFQNRSFKNQGQCIRAFVTRS